MPLVSKTPWIKAENYPASEMTLDQARAQARTLTPPGGFWRIQEVPAKPLSPTNVTGEPVDARIVIYVWYDDYEEIWSHTTKEQMEALGLSLSVSVNGPAPTPKAHETKQLQNGNWAVRVHRN